ncbi:spidroin-1-like [Helicoverpa zea]|uniref:spidroin-1-like n=1 Tax=Helicoverpa zea TaxID=7113 RepID=UPI001F56651A|nr:spidroin-1-like [Helicoverpa zea]
MFKQFFVFVVCIIAMMIGNSMQQLPGGAEGFAAAPAAAMGAGMAAAGGAMGAGIEAAKTAMAAGVGTAAAGMGAAAGFGAMG